MSEFDFYLTENDTGPPIQGTLTDEDGNPEDLTGATVEFHMRPFGGSDVGVDGTAVIVDAVAGIVAYEWSPGDTDSPGVHDAEFEVVFPDGRIQSYPSDVLSVFVREEVA